MCYCAENEAEKQLNGTLVYSDYKRTITRAHVWDLLSLEIRLFGNQGGTREA